MRKFQFSLGFLLFASLLIGAFGYLNFCREKEFGWGSIPMIANDGRQYGSSHGTYEATIWGWPLLFRKDYGTNYIEFKSLHLILDLLLFLTGLASAYVLYSKAARNMAGKRWRTFFRFSLAELLVGVLLFASAFFLINKRHKDEVVNYSTHGPGETWIWLREEGYPFQMRELQTLFPYESLKVLEQNEITSARYRGSWVLKSGISKLIPPESFESDEIMVSGVVYNVLIDLLVLFALHLLFVIYWRERQKEKPIHAP